MEKNKDNTKNLCLKCKGGRLLCGKARCPLLTKKDYPIPNAEKLKKEIYGPSTSLFVGWGGYPLVNAGPMVALDDERPDTLDNPGSWYGKSVDDIVYMRSQIVRGRQRRPVKDRSRYIDDLQELALSVKPVDSQTNYRKAPKYSMSFSPVTQPLGATGDVRRFKVIENPVIPRKVDYIVSDELGANTQLNKLFDRKFDVYYLTNVLSSGVLGHNRNQKLVPTRWSITAVDDILAKQMIDGLKDTRWVNEVMVFENTYMDNHFEILLMPGAWEFELFEAWSANTLWTRGESEPNIVVEHELSRGRKDYAYNEGGGYYAARFSAAEALTQMGRQARVVIFREIYDTYTTPVGVWEVRENVRKAFTKEPRKFATTDDALRDIDSRLNIKVTNYMRKSTILRQKRITDYM